MEPKRSVDKMEKSSHEMFVKTKKKENVKTHLQLLCIEIILYDYNKMSSVLDNIYPAIWQAP
jgi:hypothetical protein